MPPKKKEVQKFSLGEFMTEPTFGGSWADEVEDTYGTQPLPPSDRRGGSGFGGGYGGSSDRMPHAPRDRDSFPQRLPDKPPYTAHLGNLSYDATNETVTEFFSSCEVVSVRIVEDREQQRPKGFGYAEFATVEGLQKALNYDGDSFQGRVIRVRIADPPKNSEGRSEARELDWSQPRKGPLADMPRNNDRRGQNDFGERREFGSGGGGGGDRRDFGERREFNNDRRGPREPADDGKVRDFSDWSRKGPLSPCPDPVRQNSSREGSRPPMEGGGGDSFNRNDRRASPAAWGEGRQNEGSRPPRREFSERPIPERAPTAAEKDMQWRNSMRPDQPAKSPGQSRSGSEAPPSPAPAAAVPAGPAGRPKLNLTKRTISEAPDVTSPALASTDSKASPFGAARPIDTAAKEREIEEKRLAAIKEKKEAEEKAKEERRIAKEEADKKAAEEQAKAAEQKEAAEKAENNENKARADESTVEKAAEGAAAAAAAAAPTEQKLPVRAREPQNVPKSRATESGNWRSVSGEQRGGRGPPTGPRRGGSGGGPRGGRNDGQRPPRANGGGQQSQPATPVSAGPNSSPEEDGWTTVKKAKGSGRPIAS